MKPIKAVLFDLFESLVTESALPPTRASSLGPSLALDAEAFRIEWKHRRQEVILGRLSFTAALAEITAALGGSTDGAALEKIRLARLKEKAAPFTKIEPEVLDTVERLRCAGIRLAVISNNFAEDVAAWPDCALGPLFDVAIFSSQVGLAKPDSGIYLHACHALGSSPSEAIYVGDGADDELAGAEGAGLRAYKALWFLRRWPHFRDVPTAHPTLPEIGDLARLVLD